MMNKSLSHGIVYMLKNAFVNLSKQGKKSSIGLAPVSILVWQSCKGGQFWVKIKWRHLWYLPYCALIATSLFINDVKQTNLFSNLNPYPWHMLPQGVVYLDQHLGAVQALVQICFFYIFWTKNIKKEEQARKLRKFVFWFCTKTLVKGYLVKKLIQQHFKKISTTI